MSMDISDFIRHFFDEADELLADMEQHLLVLQPEAPDAEQLNAIFRAAHSIKGGQEPWLQRFAGNHASDGKPAR